MWYFKSTSSNSLKYKVLSKNKKNLQVQDQKYLIQVFFFLVTLFRVGLFYPQLNLRQLIQPDLESRFIVRSQLGPSIQSGFSPSARLQVVTKSTHLSKDCYPSWYRTHIFPKFGLQNSWITGACHYTWAEIKEKTVIKFLISTLKFVKL